MSGLLHGLEGQLGSSGTGLSEEGVYSAGEGVVKQRLERSRYVEGVKDVGPMSRGWESMLRTMQVLDLLVVEEVRNMMLGLGSIVAAADAAAGIGLTERSCEVFHKLKEQGIQNENPYLPCSNSEIFALTLLTMLPKVFFPATKKF